VHDRLQEWVEFVCLAAAVLKSPPMPEGQSHLCLDRGYDYDVCRQAAGACGYTPHIPDSTKSLPAPTALQRHSPRRWLVEIEI